MKYLIRIILSLLTIGLFSCSQNSKLLEEKASIDISLVDSVIVMKPNRNDSTTNIPIRLSRFQIKTFVDKWNESKGIGMCKYMPTYVITIYLTDKKTRDFRINGASIKEDKDWCYDLGDSDFISKLLMSNE